MGLLERCHSYKDKTARASAPNHGLFAYPVLMAADILIYDSNIVPVGRDQKQHVEVTRDIAIKFNETYGETLRRPGTADPRRTSPSVPGLDGQKMSKSYGNTIEIFGDEKALRKKIMGIVMDSRTPAEPKPDADKNLAIQLLKLVAPAEVAQDYEDRLRAGGLGYGDLKKALFEHYWNYFAAARAPSRRTRRESRSRARDPARRRRARPRRGRPRAPARPPGVRDRLSELFLGRAGLRPALAVKLTPTAPSSQKRRSSESLNHGKTDDPDFAVHSAQAASLGDRRRSLLLDGPLCG